MRIKSLSIVSVIFLTMFSISAVASEWCEGYKAGYVTGYKQASGSSVKPVTPVCPVKPVKGLGDPKSDYEFGYTRGFQKGQADGRR